MLLARSFGGFLSLLVMSHVIPVALVFANQGTGMNDMNWINTSHCIVPAFIEENPVVSAINREFRTQLLLATLNDPGVSCPVQRRRLPRITATFIPNQRLFFPPRVELVPHFP